MSVATNQEMHRDHVEWSSDCNMWHDDIRAWQLEVAATRAIIGQLAKALHVHEETLRQHAAAIRLNQQLPAAHEHVLKLHENGCPGRAMVPTDAQHSLEASKHTELKAAHENLKQRHHTTVAAWSHLLRTLRVNAGSESGTNESAQIDA